MNYTTRNVYLLTRKDEIDWDEAEGFVVVAISARHARRLASLRAGGEGGDTWLDAALTKVSKLGTANDNSRDRIALRAFHSG